MIPRRARPPRPLRHLPASCLAAALVAGGCASGVLPPYPNVEDEIAELEARIVELQREAAKSDVEIRHLRRKVAELEGRGPTGGASGPAPPPPAASVGPALPVTPPPPVEEDDLDVEDLMAEGSGAAPPPVRSLPPSEPPPRRPAEPVGQTRADPGSAAPAQPVTEAAQALYDQGYTLYHQGRYVDSESTFQRFLQGYGTTDLADNALYWIGEARIARGDPASALDAFQEVVERYPEGNKVPDALLQIGSVLEETGDREEARAAYRMLLDRFPRTAAAAVAEERLDGLR